MMRTRRMVLAGMSCHSNGDETVTAIVCWEEVCFSLLLLRVVVDPVGFSQDANRASHSVVFPNPESPAIIMLKFMTRGLSCTVSGGGNVAGGSSSSSSEVGTCTEAKDRSPFLAGGDDFGTTCSSLEASAEQCSVSWKRVHVKRRIPNTGTHLYMVLSLAN